MLEIWGGLECTVNRVGDSYNDQCISNGHDSRATEDIERFGALGIKKLRYPVIWEKVAPESLEQCDWSATDERLNWIKSLGVDPIVGLVHHGSGPKYTSLLDENFPELLAHYAGKVAERYPWVEWYTPVNEPNTTARFSALYGVWYPHARDDKSFLRALYNEIKGTILAMREIRKVNANAKLVQTEDLGRAGGTEILRYQVDFENERRWLGFDMLFGRIDENHPMHHYVTASGGLSEVELAWLRDNPCAPDLLGINHYPLSNRFLDHRVDLYPEYLRGGNGIHRYADVGAVDAGQTIPPYSEDILRDVWARYHRPFVVTEAHITGGRESQMRWLREVWDAALIVRKEGADIRAVTAWSLLGAYDWNTLCSKCDDFYESGVFDVRSKPPRATALAKMIRGLADKGTYEHPVIERPGYWREPSRVLFAPPEKPLPSPAAMRPKPSRPIAITGATGTLGRAFARVCESRGLDYTMLSRQDMDIASRESVSKVIRDLNPWAIINTAGYVRVDDAETDVQRCLRENAEGPSNLARACADAGVQLLTFSSDLVFDGLSAKPYRESDRVAPLNVYGQSKAQAETRVLDAHPGALVVRTSAFFGPWDEHNFAHITMRSLLSGEPVRAASDVTVSPTYVPDLVWMALDLLIDRETGLVHLANQGAISWSDWALWAAKAVNVDSGLVVACRMEDFGLPAKRPKYTVLESERARVMPPLDKALHLYLQSREEIR